MKKWNLHIDHPWSGCVKKEGSTPYRAYIKTPKVFITVALWPGHGSQVYDWRTKKYTRKWSWITFHPIK